MFLLENRETLCREIVHVPRKLKKKTNQSTPSTILFIWVRESFLFNFIFYCTVFFMFSFFCSSVDWKAAFFTLFRNKKRRKRIKQHAIPNIREKIVSLWMYARSYEWLCVCIFSVEGNHLLMPWLRAYQYRMVGLIPRIVLAALHVCGTKYFKSYCRFTVFIDFILYMFSFSVSCCCCRAIVTWLCMFTITTKCLAHIHTHKPREIQTDTYTQNQSNNRLGLAPR